MPEAPTRATDPRHQAEAGPSLQKSPRKLYNTFQTGMLKTYDMVYSNPTAEQRRILDDQVRLDVK